MKKLSTESIKDFLNKRLRNAQYILNLSDKPEDIYKQEGYIQAIKDTLEHLK